MRVKSLNIKNLRNISSTQLDLDPSLNCFIGDNGAGKTSILEALSVLSKGRSFRTGQIASIIGPDHHSFQVVSKIESHAGQPHQLGMERDEGNWSARHNGENITQLSELTKFNASALVTPVLSSPQTVTGHVSHRIDHTTRMTIRYVVASRHVYICIV